MLLKQITCVWVDLRLQSGFCFNIFACFLETFDVSDVCVCGSLKSDAGDAG